MGPETKGLELGPRVADRDTLRSPRRLRHPQQRRGIGGSLG